MSQVRIYVDDSRVGPVFKRISAKVAPAVRAAAQDAADDVTSCEHTVCYKVNYPPHSTTVAYKCSMCGNIFTKDERAEQLEKFIVDRQAEIKWVKS